MIKQSTFLRRVLKALIEAGWNISYVNDGEEDVRVDNSVTKAVNVVKGVDIAWIKLTRGAEQGSITAVWQGPDDRYPDGEEIVSDYTMNLDPIIENLYTTI